MVVTKLFRNPNDAKRAVEELISKGYTEGEIGTLSREGSLLGGKEVTLPGVGSFAASGPVMAALSEASDEAALAKALEIPEEKNNYYLFGISMGGVLVSVHSDEPRARQAQRILKEAESIPQLEPIWSNSPGFVPASRMSSTNPVDAPMTGDFRKY